MACDPWYTCPRIDQLGTIDPQGNYWKPDSNVLTAFGQAITNLLPGTVTDVRRTSYGQAMVTVKLDNPLNQLATSQFYEHMHSAAVKVGQHVNTGDLIGYANNAGEGASPGYGLYPGDVYGSGPGWNELQADLAPGGAGLLNPVPVLNSFARSGSYTSGSSNPNCPGSDTFIVGSVIGAWCSFRDWLANFLQHAILLALALILIIMGFHMLGARPLQGMQKAGKAFLASSEA